MKYGKIVLLGAWIGLTILFSISAMAQSEIELDELKHNMERLRDDMNGLQKHVYRSRAAYPAVKGSPEVGVEFATIDEKMRQLNGKMEELQFRTEELTKKYDTLTQDVYERLAAIENRMDHAGIPAAVSPVPSQVSSSVGDSVRQVPEGNRSRSGVSSNQDIIFEKGPEAIISSSAEEGLPVPPSGTQAKVDALTPAAEYQKAFQLVGQERYEESEAAFQHFIGTYPNNPLVENSYYWLGETFYRRGNYAQAASHFMKGYQAYPKGNKSIDNLFKLALTLNHLDKNKEACTTFRKLTSEFPDMTPYIRERVEKERKRIGCAS